MILLTWLLILFAAPFNIYCGVIPETSTSKVVVIEIAQKPTSEWVSSPISTSEAPEIASPMYGTSDASKASSPTFSTSETTDASSPIISSSDTQKTVSTSDTTEASSPIISSSDTPKTTLPIVSTSDTTEASSPIISSSDTPKTLLPIVSTSSPIFSTLEATIASTQDAEEDCGEPLFLTPLIEAGNVSEAQRLARVPFTDHLNITSYSGFLTVNNTYNSNQFFWYFPPTKADGKTAPIILWLQGGPGGSSLYGLLKENGPIFYTEDKGFQIREYHWAIDHHMIYIDNPVGTGYSFTEEESGYCTNEVQIGEELYSSVVQFLKLFPELQHNEFYITGESYAGKYIPALGYTIHEKNQDAELTVNLKGMAIGDGLCDPEHQIGYGEHAYQVGLIDWQDKEEATRMENNFVRYIQKKNWEHASFMYYNARYFAKTGLPSHFNYVSNQRPSFLEAHKPPFSSLEFKRDIHVGNRIFAKDKVKVAEKLGADIMQSVAPWIAELLNHYRILFYNGQFDLKIPYPVTLNFLRNLNFSSAKEYKNAPRKICKIDGVIAWYYKEAGNLTEMLVRNSGHMVPEDQPKWALRLIQIFTQRLSYAIGCDVNYPFHQFMKNKAIDEK